MPLQGTSKDARWPRPPWLAGAGSRLFASVPGVSSARARCLGTAQAPRLRAQRRDTSSKTNASEPRRPRPPGVRAGALERPGTIANNRKPAPASHGGRGRQASWDVPWRNKAWRGQAHSQIIENQRRRARAAAAARLPRTCPGEARPNPGTIANYRKTAPASLGGRGRQAPVKVLWRGQAQSQIIKS